jgi:myosin heavy subunit
LEVLSAILHLGNVLIELKSRRVEDAKINETDEHLPIVADLLKIDPKLLSTALLSRKLMTGKDVCCFF